jgi:hypothetical protein
MLGTRGSRRHLPVELLCLGCDRKIDILLLCSQCQPAAPELQEVYQRVAICRCSLTEVIDVEDAADGTTRPAVLDLALCRRCRGVVNGRIDLAQGLGHDFCCGHG